MYVVSDYGHESKTFTFWNKFVIFLNTESALHLLDEAIATPRQPLHTASSLLRTVNTPTPLRQQPMSALRHSACMYYMFYLAFLITFIHVHVY